MSMSTQRMIQWSLLLIAVLYGVEGLLVVLTPEAPFGWHLPVDRNYGVPLWLFGWALIWGALGFWLVQPAQLRVRVWRIVLVGVLTASAVVGIFVLPLYAAWLLLPVSLLILRYRPRSRHRDAASVDRLLDP